MDDVDERAGPHVLPVGADGKIDWVRDYGAMEHGGVMYVKPAEIVSQLKDVLASP